MGKVVLDMAMSFDGFIADSAGQDGGLHDYFFNPSPASAKVIEEGFQTTGAIIMGRETYNTGAEQGGFADFPYQVPVFVLSSSVPEPIAQGAEAFIFSAAGIEQVLSQAQAGAGEKNVVLGGGANIAQQFIRAGLVDELQIALVPILLGSGLRLFDHLGISPIQLERLWIIDAPDVTHLKFRIIK